MGLFGGSSKVSNTTTVTANVSVDPTIDVDIASLADSQKASADKIGAALGSAGQSLGQGVGASLQSAGDAFGRVLSQGSSDLSFAIMGAAVIAAVAVARR